LSKLAGEHFNSPKYDAHLSTSEVHSPRHLYPSPQPPLVGVKEVEGERQIGLFVLRSQIVAWAPHITLTEGSVLFDPASSSCPWSRAAPLTNVPQQEQRKVGKCALTVIPDRDLSRGRVQTDGFFIHPPQDTRDTPLAWNPSPNQRTRPGSIIRVRPTFYILRQIYEASWIDLDEDGVPGGLLASIIERVSGTPMAIQWSESVR
jgi:hypothetical protein